MKVSELGLKGKALQAAQEFAAAYPKAVFNSGKRSVESQAAAMASNVAINRQWIAQTYRQPLCKAAKLCHEWVQKHPDAVTKSAIAAGLLSVLNTLTGQELGELTLHLCGGAFDVQPERKNQVLAGQMVSFLYELAHKYGGKFLEREGGMTRWHWQVRE